MAMVPCLHQGNIKFIRKGSYGYGEPRNVPLNCARCKNTPSRGRQYRAQNGKLRKLRCTYLHGTMLGRRKYFHQKEPTGMERLEVYSASRCNNPTYLCWPSNTPSRGRQCRAQNGKLGKLGRTYGHGTVFAPSKYLYEKEAMGMEKPEIYPASRCNNPTYLCRPSKYPVSKGEVWGPEQKVV